MMFRPDERDEIAYGYAVILHRAMAQSAVSQATRDMKALRAELAFLEEEDRADLERLKFYNLHQSDVLAFNEANRLREKRSENATKRAYLAIALKAHKGFRQSASRMVDNFTAGYINSYDGDDELVCIAVTIADEAIEEHQG